MTLPIISADQRLSEKRCAKVALELGEGGALIGPSAYFCKHPPQQFNDDVAAQMVEEYASAEKLAAE